MKGQRLTLRELGVFLDEGNLISSFDFAFRLEGASDGEAANCPSRGQHGDL